MNLLKILPSLFLLVTTFASASPGASIPERLTGTVSLDLEAIVGEQSGRHYEFCQKCEIKFAADLTKTKPNKLTYKGRARFADLVDPTVEMQYTNVEIQVRRDESTGLWGELLLGARSSRVFSEEYITVLLVKMSGLAGFPAPGVALPVNFENWLYYVNDYVRPIQTGEGRILFE